MLGGGVFKKSLGTRIREILSLLDNNSALISPNDVDCVQIDVSVQTKKIEDGQVQFTHCA
jgi:hypothetical protein